MVAEAVGASVLTDDARAVLEAMLECVHPADELGPGAIEVGLLDYIMGQLRGPLQRFVPWYVEGLEELERHAATTTGTSFVDLDRAGQEAVLREIESLAPGEGPALRQFFDLVIEHAYEGLFGDPAYGGNAQGAGWQLVGYPGPRPVLSAEEQALDHVRPASAASIYTIAPFAESGPT